MTELSRSDSDSPVSTGPEAGPALAAPAKFIDPDSGELRVDALMKSYMALERRLGAGAHLERGSAGRSDDADPAPDAGSAPGGEPETDADADGDPDTDFDPGFEPEDGLSPADPDMAFEDAVPDNPADYGIVSDHPWLGSDAELNGILHTNGFTRNQAQLVYDLAHEHVLPLLDRMAGEIAGLRGERQLREVFPGEDWEARAEQTRQWGAAALPADLYETLAATPAGVAAMHRMMRHGEPDLLSRSGGAGPAVDEAALRRLMDDPRYWRDHDPDLIARVQDGFRRLYPD